MIGFLIAGLIIGLLAKFVLPGKQNIPLWLTVILGVIGGIAGNAIAAGFGVEETDGVDWLRHIFQIAVAAGLIALVTPFWLKRGAAR